MNVGDLVKHVPGSVKSDTISKIYQDWGHDADFKSGLVVGTKDSFALVLPTKENAKPAWYQKDELRVISESR